MSMKTITLGKHLTAEVYEHPEVGTLIKVTSVISNHKDPAKRIQTVWLRPSQLKKLYEETLDD